MSSINGSEVVGKYCVVRALSPWIVTFENLLGAPEGNITDVVTFVNSDSEESEYGHFSSIARTTPAGLTHLRIRKLDLNN